MWFRKTYALNRLMRDGSSKQLTIIADIQPSDDMTISPFGTSDRAIVLYTDSELFPSNQPPSQDVKKDTVLYNNREYTIVKVEKYDGGIIPHFEGKGVYYDLQPITLIRTVREEDGQGGYEDKEEEYATINAKVNAPQLTQSNGAAGSMEMFTQSFIIDDSTNVETSWKIKYKGEMYEILYVDRSHYDVLIVTAAKAKQRG